MSKVQYSNARWLLGVRYSNGKVPWLGGPFKYRTFWTINRLFSSPVFRPSFNTGPFNNQTQIYHLNTRLVRYSDGYCNCKREISDISPTGGFEAKILVIFVCFCTPNILISQSWPRLKLFRDLLLYLSLNTYQTSDFP